jgi:hypothetical protein
MIARCGSAVAVLGAIVFGTRSAPAQETSHGGSPVELGAPHTDALVDPSLKRSWNEGAPRPFAAVLVDAGYLYLRPRGQFGYGMPFKTWVGIEANPILVSAGLGGYGGLRFAWDYVDLRVGARWFGAFQHAFLVPQGSFDRLDLDRTDQPKARFTTLEAELNVAVPAGPGDVLATASASSVHGVPEGLYVFEETLRVIVDPPFVWRGRAGYVFRFGENDHFALGPVVDVLDVPRRDDSVTVRAGPVMRIQLSRHFDVRGSFVTTIASPDSLGLVGGDFTELGVRYRTATE